MSSARTFEVYDLDADPRESRDISKDQPAVAARLRETRLQWNASVDASVAGKDYPESWVLAKDPSTQSWMSGPEYQPYLKEWLLRPEYNATATTKSNKSE